MKKMVKILLLMSIMVFACISGTSASTLNSGDPNNSMQIEQSTININDLGFTTHDIVKVYTLE